MIRVVAVDGEAPVPSSFVGKMSLFRAPSEFANAQFYQLRSRVNLATLNLLLTRVYDPHAEVKITADNAGDLRSLATELGFDGLNEELDRFEGYTSYSGSALRSMIADLEENINEIEISVETLDSRVWELQSKSDESCDLTNELRTRVEEISDNLHTFEEGLYRLSHRVEHLELMFDDRTAADAKLQETIKLQDQKIERLEKLLNDKVKGDEKVQEKMMQQMTIREQKLERLEQLLNEHPKTAPISMKPSHKDPKPEASSGTHRGASKSPPSDVIFHVVKPTPQPALRPNALEFRYDGQSPLSGIIAYLTGKHGGNVSETREIQVTASSQAGQASHVAELGTSSFYMSVDKPDQWICYEFRSGGILPTSYVLMSYGKGQGGCHPKDWILEASTDGKTWAKLDSRRDDQHLNASHVVYRFTIGKVPVTPYRFLRFRLIGANHRGHNVLMISSFEVFGTYVEGTSVGAVQKSPASNPSSFGTRGGVVQEARIDFRGDSFDGIIAYLTRQCAGNVAEKGIVEVRPDTRALGRDPSRVVNFSSADDFQASRVERSPPHIIFDFRNRKVVPTAYTLRTSQNPQAVHLQSWVFEGSNDGQKWTELDKRDNEDVLIRRRVQTFRIGQSPAFHMFQIRPTDGKDTFWLNAFEIFGILAKT